jgi:hypothetical protein
MAKKTNEIPLTRDDEAALNVAWESIGPSYVKGYNDGDAGRQIQDVLDADYLRGYQDGSDVRSRRKTSPRRR